LTTDMGKCNSYIFIVTSVNVIWFIRRLADDKYRTKKNGYIINIILCIYKYSNDITMNIVIKILIKNKNDKINWNKQQ